MVTPTILTNQLAVNEVDLVSTGEVQLLANVSHVAVYKWVKAGKLHPVIVGKQMGSHGGRMKLFRRAEVIAFLAERRKRKAKKDARTKGRKD